MLAALVCGTDAGAAQILRLGLDAAGPGSFDPHAASSDRIVVDMLFNGLLRYQPGNYPIIEPDLAEAVPTPKMIAGKQCWTFVLRKGVLFHPGPQGEAVELTSDDVIYSLQKAADQARSAYAALYTGMAFQRVDDYTLQVVMDKPLSAALFLPRFTCAAGGAILCRRAMEGQVDASDKAWPVGTGPFLFAGNMAGKKISLLAHKKYFRGAPRLEGVEILFLPDTKERERGLRSGTLHVISGIRSREGVNQASQWGKTRVDAFGPGETAAIILHTMSPPMQQKAVRQALAYALQRGDWGAWYGKALFEECSAPVPALVPGGMTNTAVSSLALDYAKDLAKARRLLEEAGYPDGFSVSVQTTVGPDAQAIVAILKKQLRQISVAVKAVERADRATPDIEPLIFNTIGLATAEDFFPRLFPQDYPKMDTLIEAAHGETNAKKQLDLWRYIQMKTLDDMVVYPLGTILSVYARSAGVDYGHPLVRTGAPYPQITELTWIKE